MRIKVNILETLRVRAMEQLTFRHPMAPCMVMSMLQEKDMGNNPPPLPACEFGWSGLQTLCVTQKAIEILKSKNMEPYAFEGIGYVSMNQEMFDDFDKEAACELEDFDKNKITQLVSHLVAATLHELKAGDFCIVQLHSRDPLEFPEGMVGWQVHVIVPTTEGNWMGLYQIHAQELQAATAFYNSIKGGEVAAGNIADALSPTRVLN